MQALVLIELRKPDDNAACHRKDPDEAEWIAQLDGMVSQGRIPGAPDDRPLQLADDRLPEISDETHQAIFEAIREAEGSDVHSEILNLEAEFGDSVHEATVDIPQVENSGDVRSEIDQEILKMENEFSSTVDDAAGSYPIAAEETFKEATGGSDVHSEILNLEAEFGDSVHEATVDIPQVENSGDVRSEIDPEILKMENEFSSTVDDAAGSG